MTMRLSEAIRLGAMLGPQLFGKLFDANGGSCAVGAAMKAVGRRYVCSDDFPILNKQCNYYPVPIPREERYGDDVWSVIVWLNNEARWSRERIAEWVEGEERRLGYFDAPAVAQSQAEQAEIEEVLR